MLGGFGWLILAHDPNGGQPRVVATIEKGDPITTGSVTPKVALRGTSPEARAPQLERPASADIDRPSAPDALSVERKVAALTTAASGLARAPIAHLVEESEYGPLPRRTDGETPALAYARPLSRDQVMSQSPRVVLIIGGVGLNPRMSQMAVDHLPPEVTMAVSSQGDHVQMWIDRARQDGHEVLLQIPMEPEGYPQRDPGPRTLLTSETPDEIAKDLRWHMSRATGYFGVINHQGSRFTSDPQAMQTVLKELRQRGIAFIEDNPTDQSQASTVAKATQLDYAKVDVMITSGVSPEAIDRALDRLIGIAKNEGFAVGAAVALPTTLQRLAPWVEKLESEGIILVPASAALTFLDR